MDAKRWAYINFKKYSVRYDLEADCFDATVDGMGTVIRGAKIVSAADKKGVVRTLSDFGRAEVKRGCGQDELSLAITYAGEACGRRNLNLILSLSDAGFRIGVVGDNSGVNALEGEIRWGDHDPLESMSVCLNRMGDDLRVASGPATAECDDALFDPDTDSALEYHSAGNFRVRFDWESGAYRFHFDNAGKDYGCWFTLSPVWHVYEHVFHMDYKKANPDTTFKTPPVGFMTWYAVQFDAGEKTVLENAEFQKKYLQKYGADTIWVDWEWYHRDFSGVGDSDVDMFHPDPKAYPNGLKYVAEKIAELGFTPALWVGPTNDPTEDEMVKKHPEAILIRRPEWCGQYFFDVTHPAFLTEVLSKMLNQPLDWGYQAIKWDCLPHTLALCDTEHEKLTENGWSSRQAMLNAFQTARRILGKDYYMLYCCALSQRDMDLACQVFDAARIGGDIFRWDDFLNELVDKLYRYYALHNVVMLADPDNVVIREKFNTFDQARTRAAIVSLCGLPFTFGDNLPELPEDRLEILRRSIPPIPHARPMDIRTTRGNRREMKINLAIERPFGRWNVLDLVNLAEEDAVLEVDLKRDLHLPIDGSSYYVYDFWDGELLGEMSDRLSVGMGPCASRILSVVKNEGRPQVISTSRHISHGAIDLVDVKWDAEGRVLSGVSQVVGGKAYSLVVTGGPRNMTPAQYSNHTNTAEVAGVGGGLYKLTYHPEEDGALSWSIGYVPGPERGD